ncbi:NADH(P)-binding-domain-containing protein [Cyathus striatus]|nr:NADH(P)-binding-domain-containing protein [Cyathus striatus]
MLPPIRISFLHRFTTSYKRYYSHFSMSKKVIIVGGHGNVSLRLARILAPNHTVTSIIRSADHEKDITDISAKPLILSLEDSSVEDFSKAFTGQDVVYFSAGAGGKGGTDRTKAVDYEGAVKVFDALEGVNGSKPRLILVSAVDIRDPEKIPAHYNEADIAQSKRTRGAIATYMHWKYEADKNLVKRNAFKWTILRPGGLNFNPGTGKASIGRTHITTTISRDDVAEALALLVDREDAASLAIDIVGGDTPIGEGLDAFIKKGETDFLG